MPKYDAFGREIDENTLAGLGGDSRDAARESEAADWEAAAALREAAAGEPAVPAPAARPVVGDPPQAAPPTITIGDPQRAAPEPARPPRRSAGCLLALILLVVIIGGVGLAGLAIFSAAKDAIDDVTGSIDDPALQVPAPPPTGITGDSLIAPANLTRVLGQLEPDGKRAMNVVVRPDRIVADMAKGGRARIVQIPAEGDPSRSDARALPAAAETVALADLDPKAPTRLVRRSAARFAVRPQGIDYVTAMPDYIDRGSHHLVAYFKNGIYVEGDASGKVRRRIDR